MNNNRTAWRRPTFFLAIAVIAMIFVGISVFSAFAAETENDRPATAGDAEPAEHHHIPAPVTIEAIKQATCAEEGSYDEVTRCALCGEVLETRHIRVSCPPSHTPGAPVKENQKASTCTMTGSYESVVYCEVCGKELQRERKQLEMRNHVADHQLKRTVRRGENGSMVVTFDDPAYPPLTKKSKLPEKYDGTAVEANCFLAGDGSKRTCADGETRCATCGTLLEEAIPHTWDRDKMGKPGDMSEDGSITFSCVICGIGFRTYSSDHYRRFRYGDVDGDGIVTVADARYALRYSVGYGSLDKVITSLNFTAADVDGNKVIETADARLILRIAVGLRI